MRRALSLATLLMPFLLASCGETSGRIKESPFSGRAGAGDGFVDVPVTAHCAVVTEAGSASPENMRLFRHAAPDGSLTLSVQKLPMTCARVVKLRASWTQARDTLTLAVHGEKYAHCLCTFELEPFSLGVPEADRATLDEHRLVVERGDAATAEPLRATRIGEVPYL